MTKQARAAFETIRGPKTHPFREQAARAYDDDPEDWRKVLGDLMHFQWGLYDRATSTRPLSLDEVGSRHLDRQLELAELAELPAPQRVLDIGCGWGAALHHLARAFPHCPRLDGVNISRRQLEYCAGHLSRRGVKDRIPLYLCDAGDVGLLPDPEVPYDLVLIRGAITHFPDDLYESSMAALAERVRAGGRLVISDTFYSEEFIANEPDIPSESDHLALAHRKSLAYATRVLRESGFTILDERVLPGNADAVRWLLELRGNIAAHFPERADPPLEAIREVAIPLSIAFLHDRVSAHSIIAERRGADAGP